MMKSFEKARFEQDVCSMCIRIASTTLDPTPLESLEAPTNWIPLLVNLRDLKSCSIQVGSLSISYISSCFFEAFKVPTSTPQLVSKAFLMPLFRGSGEPSVQEKRNPRWSKTRWTNGAKKGKSGVQQKKH